MGTRDWMPINTADPWLWRCTQCRDLLTSAVPDSSSIPETLSQSSRSISNHGTSVKGCSRHSWFLERSECVGCARSRNRGLCCAELPFLRHCIMVRVKRNPAAEMDANGFQGLKVFLETLPAHTWPTSPPGLTSTVQQPLASGPRRFTSSMPRTTLPPAAT